MATERLNVHGQMEHLNAKYTGAGHVDIKKQYKIFIVCCSYELANGLLIKRGIVMRLIFHIHPC